MFSLEIPPPSLKKVPVEKVSCSTMARYVTTDVYMCGLQYAVNLSIPHHQSFIRLDDGQVGDCHIPPTLISFLKLLGSGAFLARRPSKVALSRLSSKAPLLFTWRFAAAATAGECCP